MISERDPAEGFARGYLTLEGLETFDPWGWLPAHSVVAVENVTRRLDRLGYPAAGNPIVAFYARTPEGAYVTAYAASDRLNAVPLADLDSLTLTAVEREEIRARAHQVADSMGWPRSMIFGRRFLDYAVSYPFWPGRAVR